MSVVFPWIIVHELHETQARVGIAQAIASLPMMLLILVGGAAADGRDLRGYLARLQLGTAMIPITLALVIALHQLSFASATVCLFAMAIIRGLRHAGARLAAVACVPAIAGPRPHLGPGGGGDFRRPTCGHRNRGHAHRPSVPFRCSARKPCCWQSSAVLTCPPENRKPRTRCRPASPPSSPACWPETCAKASKSFGTTSACARSRSISSLGARSSTACSWSDLPLMVRDVYHGSSASCRAC